MPVKTIEWLGGKIRIIDQTQLPEQLIYLTIDRVEELAEAIRNLRIRGAPAIGIAGAMGVALTAFQHTEEDKNRWIEKLISTIHILKETRPTAVNLFWALDRMRRLINSTEDESVETIRDRLVEEALSILEEDRQICRRIGKNGAALIPQEATILTHCNAGSLATADYGTALGVVYTAVESGKKVKVYADETRPLLQGSRLTAWELKESGIDVTVICDSAAGFLMEQKKIDCILVGADRIAANGDVANKVGTYTLAVLAQKHRIPFYVVAPLSSFDFSITSGDFIPIEERSGEEVVNGFETRTAPTGIRVYNPAFDITPHELVHAFVTEQKILYPPYIKSISDIFGKNSPK
ncbi:S-methyl-5-thioribose-1-phosphate isomerase [bacterium]|nr:S-methyl-5-thioribose-1-phosphate isomerase [bacterium]RQV97074.1 MAG: S-methyl-5-thioribose-1-phosphate isomerase [bacterium]